jgi:ribosomal-protein-alanine N-acetyltransferase
MITTERLCLIQAESSHASTLLSFWSEEESMGHMQLEPFTTAREVSEIIAIMNRLSFENQAILYTLVTKEKDCIIGSCGFDFIDLENEKAEISFELGSEYRGKGYALESISALIHYGFEELQLNRIEAKVFSNNYRSIQLLEKLEFQYEGTLRKSIKTSICFKDIHLYSILKSEYIR